MSLLYRIIYAAHANGTHHKLALDALPLLQTAQADRWRNLFLKHAAVYLEGSKAPDKTFKDFKNHVLHVRDNYWGGAPERAEVWYGKTVAALRAQQWESAVYSAGVLSHYYTDPIQPFHTAQSEAETAIHRAAEWSISRAYDDLARIGRERGPASVTGPGGTGWLKEMVCRGAETSNRYYEKLIAHYDIHRGVSDPPAGLDRTARTLLGELIVYAATGLAQILDRALAESGVTPPQVSLTMATVVAGLQMPSKWIEKRLTNAEDRALVRAMFDELQKTGRVDKTLPEDDRVVRDLYELEIEGPRAERLAAERASRVGAALPTPAPAAQRKKRSGSAKAKAAAAPPPEPAPTEPPQTAATTAAPSVSPVVAATAPQAPRADLSTPAAHRAFLQESDDLEAAPSIGPRSAEWFAEIGIFTVGEFLDADPAKMAEELTAHRVDAETLRAWQRQAHLVIDVPGLRGTHAQLLVGAGYHDAAALASADAPNLCSAVLNYAASSDGQRVLRKGEAPNAEKIKGWIERAAAQLAA
jgi:predicted flap endonuclease-1-like 5' DNA nuclease